MMARHERDHRQIYVPAGARSVPVSAALKTSFGFGGQNVALVLQRP